MVGQLSPGKELTAAFTLAFVSVVIHLLYVWDLTREKVNHPERNYGTQESSIIAVCIPLLFVFAGAICFRRLVGSRRLRAVEP
jgi:surface polysaccharide O-acyltransferase-like enzyme